MKKYVIISSNSNPDYEWYLPLVKWAWNKLGWEVVCLRPFKSDIYREETITQCIRLYAALLPQFKKLSKPTFNIIEVTSEMANNDLIMQPSQ